MGNRLYLDLETRSATDLRKAGHQRYIADPTTEITVGSFYFQGDQHVFGVVNPKMADKVTHVPDVALLPFPDLFRAVNIADEIVIHNAAFDVNILSLYGVFVPVRKVSCTMARAQSLALPGGLDALTKTLGVPGKVDAGRSLVLKTCKPRKDGWHEEPASWRDLLVYCSYDVRALTGVDRMLPELPPHERIIWERTWRKNIRGLPIDLDLCRAIADRRVAIERECTETLKRLTFNRVTKVTERAKIMQWLTFMNWPLENLRKETVEAALIEHGGEMPFIVFEVLTMLQESGGMAPTKAQSLLDRQVNGKYMDGTRYFGARSGRGTSEGTNLFNIARPSNKNKFEDIMANLAKGEPVDNTALSDALRGVIAAPPSYHVLDVDIAGAELRMSLWYAGDWEKLRLLDEPDFDLYAEQGKIIFGIENLSKKTHPLERQLSKNVVLGGGYQCGGERFLGMLRRETNVDYEVRKNMTLERATSIIAGYRKANPLLVRIWGELDAAARAALERPGYPVTAARGLLCFTCDRAGVLWLRLPSGRSLPHYDAHINESGELVYVRARFGHMMQSKAFGGAWLEIACQSAVRDVLTIAEETIEKELPEVDLRLDIYDSIVAFVPENRADDLQKKVEEILSRPLAWAAGLRLRGEGYHAKRMRK